MNRAPVTTKRLRQIIEHTGYRYDAAFERKHNPLLLCIRPQRLGGKLGDEADWVNQETWQVWPAVRAGQTLRHPMEITRTVVN